MSLNSWSAADQQVLSWLAGRFNEQSPNGRIIVQAVPLATFERDLRGQLDAGGGPQIILIPNSWIGDLVEPNVLLPLDAWLPAAERQPLLPATLAGAQRRGQDGVERVYGLPISFDTLALYYNTANVLIPPDNTADLLSLAHGLGDPRVTPPRWGLAYNLALDTTIGYLSAAGGRVFDDQGKLVLGGAGRSGTERWLKWLLQLSSDPHQFARVGSSIEFDRQLTSSTTLMAFGWTHQFTFYRRLWGTQLGIAPLPRLSQTDELPRPYVKSDVLAINRRVRADERRIAIEFLRFMVSEASQRELLRADIQPAREDLELDLNDINPLQARAAQIFRQQAEHGMSIPNDAWRQRDIARRELEYMLQQVLMHSVSPAEAITEADQRLRDRLEQATP